MSAPPLLPVDAPLPLPTKRTRHTAVAGKKAAEMQLEGSHGTVAWRHGSRGDGKRGASPLLPTPTCKRLNAFAAGARAKRKSHPRRRRLSSASCARRAWRWPPALPVSSTEKRRFACVRLRGAPSPPFRPTRPTPPGPIADSVTSRSQRCKGSAARGTAAANLNLHVLFFAFFLDSRDFNAARK